MKSEFDQEMDTLLRAHARREAFARARTAQSGAAGGAHAGAHLDADELSAYAAHALPASTRTRYATHLADCDSCRAQVVMLARAAGSADQLEQRAASTVTATHIPSWRERFAAFFAPGAWRYALPLVALFVVSGVAFWSLSDSRARHANESAASQQVASVSRGNEAPEQQHAQADEQSAADNEAGGLVNGTATTAPAATTASANTAIDTNTAAKPTATPPSGELLARNEPQAKQAEARLDSPPPPMQPTTKNAATPANVNQSAATKQTTIVNQNAGAGLSNQMNTQPSTQNVYAPLPPAATPAQAESQPGRAQNAPEEEKAGTRARDNERDAQLAAKARSAKREGGDEPRAARAEPANTRGPAKSAPAPKPQRMADDKDATDSDETVRTESRRPDAAAGAGGRAATEDKGEKRSVAGRQFRRQKSAWVDTAYRAGQATVNVHRDSEQWRALIADEPELRRIADALGGEVVVVWHGRAYRIKP